MSTLDRQARVAWMSRALCHATQVDFFSDSPEDIAAAKAVCERCPVRQPCLEFAKANHESGVWGGTAEHERQWGYTEVGGCPGCGGPLVPVSVSQEQCLVCHQTWHAART